MNALAGLAMISLGFTVGCVTDEADDDELISPAGADGKADGASACTASKSKVETAARSLMKANGLIKPGEELDGDFSSKWGLSSVTSYRDTCLAVMTPCYTFDDGEALCEPSMVEVVAYKKSGTTVKAMMFEQALPVPASLKVGIGNVGPDYHPDGTPFPDLSDDLYYMDLTGESVVMAMKSVISKVHYCGLTGLVIPGGAAAFDPTPDRTWRVVNGKFDLRRGNSHEVGDIRPAHWDGDFDGYFGGSVHRDVIVDGATVEGAEILPWGACFMRRYDENGKWTEVLDAPIR